MYFPFFFLDSELNREPGEIVKINVSGPFGNVEEKSEASCSFPVPQSASPGPLICHQDPQGGGPGTPATVVPGGR